MGIIEKLPENRKKKFKKFNRYLKDKNVYKAYYRNLYSSKEDKQNSFCVHYGGNMEHFFSECPVDSWLTQCFIWAKQPEGEVFWNNLHVNWSSKFYGNRI
jgi:hypothetical protein